MVRTHVCVCVCMSACERARFLALSLCSTFLTFNPHERTHQNRLCVCLRVYGLMGRKTWKYEYMITTRGLPAISNQLKIKHAERISHKQHIRILFYCWTNLKFTVYFSTVQLELVDIFKTSFKRCYWLPLDRWIQIKAGILYFECFKQKKTCYIWQSHLKLWV